MCNPPRQSSSVFISLFVFNNHALEGGGNLVSLGTLPLSMEGLMYLLIDLGDLNHHFICPA